MSADETELEMVERHVREGERHIAKQREMIREMAANDRPTEAASQLLATFEDLQRLHREHLARLREEHPIDAPGNRLSPRLRF